MDKFKTMLAQKVHDVIRDELERYDDFEGATIEVQEISPTEQMIRAKGDGGLTRYFRLKLSEMM